MDLSLERPEGTEGRWIGERPSAIAIAALLIIGTVGLEITGVQPVLLGALVAEHRLSASALGWATTAEFLTIALTIGLAGAVMKPRGLRLVAALAAVIALGCDLHVSRETGTAIVVNRAVAGCAEGLLVWIPTSMVARSATPALWAGIFLTMQCCGQLLFAVVVPMTLMERFGANGGFAALAGTAILALAAAPFIPRAFADLPSHGEAARKSILPSGRGLAGLAAVFLVAAFAIGFFAYLAPLATQDHLSPKVLGLAVSAVLAAMIVGSAAASITAKHLTYYPVFLVCLLAYAIVLILVAIKPGASIFIAAAALYGFFQVFFMPFQLPLVIEADPTRKSAVILPGVQLCGAASGPFFCSFFVTDTNSSGALIVCAVCLAGAFLITTALHFWGRRAAPGGRRAGGIASSPFKA